MTKSWHLAVVVGSFVFATSTAAFASPDGVRAQALFDEARTLVKEGRFDEACEKFEESQRLDPGAGTLLNLANCYEKAGKTANAWRTYREAGDVAERTGRGEWASSARDNADRLRASLSTLTIDVPPSTDVTGLAIERDGVAVSRGDWGKDVVVDPGAHVVRARANGKKTREQSVSVDASSSARVTIAPLEDLEPVEAPTRASVDMTEPDGGETRSGGATQRTVGYVVGAAGIVGLGLGAVFGLSAIGSKNDAASDGHCSDGLEKCDPFGIDAMHDARRSAAISTIGFIAGGALAATGIVLVLTAPSDKDAATTTNGGFRSTLRLTGNSVTFGGAF